MAKDLNKTAAAEQLGADEHLGADEPAGPAELTPDMAAAVEAAVKARVDAAVAEALLTHGAPAVAVAEADLLDVTDQEFTEADVDERGWIVFYEQPREDGTRPYHRVPVMRWAAYERAHGF